MTDWEGSAVTGTLAALERRHDAIKAAAEAMLLEARADGMETLDDARDAKFRAMRTDLADLEYRIDTQRAEVARMGRLPTNLARATQTPIRKDTVSTRVIFEPLTYRRGDNKHSYMRDLIRLQLNRDDDGSSRDRLIRARGRHRRRVHRVQGSGPGRRIRRLRGAASVVDVAVRRAGTAGKGVRESLPAPAATRWDRFD